MARCDVILVKEKTGGTITINQGEASLATLDGPVVGI